VRAILNEALLVPNNITYPLPELIVGGGFLCVLFVEKLMVMLFSRRQAQAR